MFPLSWDGMTLMLHHCNEYLNAKHIIIETNNIYIVYI